MDLIERSTSAWLIAAHLFVGMNLGTPVSLTIGIHGFIMTSYIVAKPAYIHQIRSITRYVEWCFNFSVSRYERYVHKKCANRKYCDDGSAQVRACQVETDSLEFQNEQPLEAVRRSVDYVY